ncbi:hypothetical protein NDU88_006800 [Pleurodeles waltl]|uniref:Uncharacterized protein n=1 Tax=Pleurodeles waltl TaxID=8319 RepID=A0AAV7PJD8_PLEWA|nr:hypothetical protein NDU88_006800 [Pleurodeles waltl]
MVETVRGGLSRRPAPPVFCPGPALREGPAEPFLPPGAELEEKPGRAPGCPNPPRSVWRAALGCLSPEPKNPTPGQGWECMPPQGPSRPGSASRPLGPLAGEAATGHRVRAPAGRGWRAHSRRPTPSPTPSPFPCAMMRAGRGPAGPGGLPLMCRAQRL